MGRDGYLLGTWSVKYLNSPRIWGWSKQRKSMVCTDRPVEFITSHEYYTWKLYGIPVRNDKILTFLNLRFVPRLVERCVGVFFLNFVFLFFSELILRIFSEFFLIKFLKMGPTSVELTKLPTLLGNKICKFYRKNFRYGLVTYMTKTTQEVDGT